MPHVDPSVCILHTEVLRVLNLVSVGTSYTSLCHFYVQFAERGLQWPGLTSFFNLWVEHNEDCPIQSSKSKLIVKLTL